MSFLIMMALGTATGLIVAHSRMTISVSTWSDQLVDMSKIGKVTILMPTLNEAAWIENAIASLKQQNVRVAYPESFELVVVDSYSEDDTAEIAQQLADKVIMAPSGKLTAIDTALRETDGDIIVAVDGDSFYDVNFLNLLLKPFEDPKVVAVSGAELLDKAGVRGVTSIWWEANVHTIYSRMMGRGCAYRREAYFATGGFNLETDQKNMNAMQAEEEYEFWARLSQVGKCMRELRASVRTTERRLNCESCSPSNSPECSYCQQVESGERF